MRVAYIFPSIPTRNDQDPDIENLTRNKKDWLGQEAESVKRELDKRHPGSAVSVHIMYTYDAEIVTDGLEWFATKPPNFMTGRWWYQGKQWSYKWYKKILAWEPDIIHWQMNSYAYTFHLATRGFVRHKVPYVYQHHGPHLARKSWVRWVLKYPHYHAERGIYLTRYHEEQYSNGLNLDKSKNVLIPPGHDIKFHHPHDKEKCKEECGFAGNPILFWCGGFNRRKDPITVLKAFDNIACDFPEARFYMAGYGPLDEEVDEFIQSRPALAKQVIRLGYVENEKIVLMENAADIFVMGSRGEGFCVASMEAMACGCFPILTTLDGFMVQTQQGKLGLHFEPGDVDGCTECLRKAVGDVEYRENIRKQLPEAVIQWAWPNIAGKLVDLYEEVLDSKKK